MLGIIIGISSVISVVTVGTAMSESVSNSIAQLGVSNILISLQNRDDDSLLSFLGSHTEYDLISDEMIEMYFEYFQDRVEAISLSNVGGPAQVRNGDAFANITFMGVNTGHAAVYGINMLEGRFIDEYDLESKNFAAVVSDKFLYNMYLSYEEHLGREIEAELNGIMQTFTIVGIYQHEVTMLSTDAATSDRDLRTSLFMPLTTLNMLNYANSGHLALIVKAKYTSDVSILVEDTRNFFNSFYEDNVRFEIGVVSLESMLSIVTDIMDNVGLAIAVIGGISLAVGGIGIMNIMLVSVTERTREIGMKKAIGARNLSIQIQFIVEAVFISGLGGLLGSLFGAALGFGGSSMLDNPTLPSLSVIVISVLFSMFIGVTFGFYPANKAANLDPVEALRYE